MRTMYADMTAAGLYGGAPSPQPNATGVPDHPPGSPEPKIRTVKPSGVFGLMGDPVFVLVALLAAAWLVLHVSLGFDASVKVEA